MLFIPKHIDYADTIADFCDDRANSASAAAALAGAAEGLNLVGRGGQFIRARPDETDTEFAGSEIGVQLMVAPTSEDAIAALGGSQVGSAVLRAETQQAARQAIGTPTVTISTAGPSGGQNGDLWLQY